MQKAPCVQRETKTLDASDILDAHDERSIAVCNTVERSQHLFENLCALAKERACTHEIVLLHSRFLPQRTLKKEEKIRNWFGKDANKRRPAILVATQVIEVGLDLTCEHLHTEIAPAAAIIQRAGRCARFPGESGTVCIYDVPEMENGNKYLPYDDQDSQLSSKTWKAMRQSSINGQDIGFRQEQNLIQKVYEVVDQQTLTETAINSRRAEIAGPDGVMTTLERADYRNLVRFVDSRSFFVHSHPQELEDPLRMQTFSVSPGILARAWKELSQTRDEWFARLVIAEHREADTEVQGYSRPVYRYEPVAAVDDFFREYFFVINPIFVDYTEEAGLRFRCGGNAPEQLTKTQARRRRECYNYALETYRDHIQEVWLSYERNFESRARFDFIVARLAQRYKVPDEYVREAHSRDHRRTRRWQTGR